MWYIADWQSTWIPDNRFCEPMKNRYLQFRMRYWIFCLLWMLPLLLVAGNMPVSAQETEPSSVVVIGSSTIQDNNRAAAKDLAVAAALDAAVEQAAISVFSPEALAQDFQRFSLVIRGKTDAFIDTYRILAESSVGNRYRVMLQATVSAGKLQEQLSGFRNRAATPATKPTVLFLLAEQNLDDLSPTYWWGENEGPVFTVAEQAMAEKMKAAGFEVVDHGNEVPDVTLEAAIVFQPDLDNRDAVDIGKSLNADYVVVGKAIVYQVPELDENEIPAFNATLTARIVGTETGEEISSVLETVVQKNPDPVTGSREALMAAGAMAGEKLAAEALSRWQARTPEVAGDRIALTVTGTRNLGNFIRFRRALSETPGVKDLRMDEMNPDEAVIQVAYEGNTRELAEALAMMSFRLFRIDIQDVTETYIRISLAPQTDTL